MQGSRAFSDEVDTGSSKKMRPNKKLERLPPRGSISRQRNDDRALVRKAG
ncbi:MAG: hypothetical protein H6875_06910 [Hyphomicrobiaceae bacterium]|nr:hypothetical protein [Hyphomicrobiaceae bacterium]